MEKVEFDPLPCVLVSTPNSTVQTLVWYEWRKWSLICSPVSWSEVLTLQYPTHSRVDTGMIWMGKVKFDPVPVFWSRLLTTRSLRQHSTYPPPVLGRLFWMLSVAPTSWILIALPAQQFGQIQHATPTSYFQLETTIDKLWQIKKKQKQNKNSKCSNDPHLPRGTSSQSSPLHNQPSWTLELFQATLLQNDCTSSSFHVTLSEHPGHSHYNQTVELSHV